MATYKLRWFGKTETFRSKDDIIYRLLGYINGDGGGPSVRLEFLDGSFFDFPGSD